MLIESVSEIVTAQRSPLGLLIVGAVAVAIGVGSIVFRLPLLGLILRAQAKGFGSAVGERMKATKPWAIAVAGAIWVGIGAVALTFSIIQFATPWP